MRYYEMLFIVHPNYEQDRLEAVIKAVEDEITAKGGKILKTDNWGKRKLAYLINKQRYGSYVLMYFGTDPQAIRDLHEWMEIQAQVMHQMIIRLEDEPELSDESENPDSISSYSKKDDGPARPDKEVRKDKVTDDDGSDETDFDDDEETEEEGE